jgi:sortase A
MTRLPRAELVFWGSGFALLAIWGAARAYGGWSARRDVARFDHTVAVAQTQGGQILAAAVDTSEWSAARRRRYEDASSSAASSAIAVMRIERVGLTVPVLEGTDELTLDRAAGHIEGTPRPGAGGNVGIAGHRDGFFRGLKDVGKGDVIELRTLSGMFDYVVTELRVVAPDDVSVLSPTAAPSLTLVTCYPFYFVGAAPQRYVVRAVRR